MSMLRRWNREQNSNGHIPVRTDETNEVASPSLYNFEQRINELFENFLGEWENTLNRINRPNFTSPRSNNWDQPAGPNPPGKATYTTQRPGDSTVNPSFNTPNYARTGANWTGNNTPSTRPNVGGPSGGWEGFTPHADFSETDEEYRISCDLPGLSREDIEVMVWNNSVVLRGERTAETEKVEGDYHQRERQYGVFRRNFPLPGDVDPEQINAKFDNGVLMVSLPKTEESRSSRRRIDISTK